MATRYAHTNIIAEDWQSLATFYTEVFACVRVPPERDLSGDWLARATGVTRAALKGVHLRLPGHGEAGPTLEIFSYAQALDAPTPAPNRKGIGHLAFEVDRLEATLRSVLEYGGKALGEVTTQEIPGAGTLTFIYVSDPEGNCLELQSWS